MHSREAKIISLSRVFYRSFFRPGITLLTLLNYTQQAAKCRCDVTRQCSPRWARAEGEPGRVAAAAAGVSSWLGVKTTRSTDCDGSLRRDSPRLFVDVIRTGTIWLDATEREIQLDRILS